MAKRTATKPNQEEARRALAVALERQRELTKDMDIDEEELERYVAEIVDEVRHELYEERLRKGAAL